MVEIIAALMTLCQTHECKLYSSPKTVTIIACVPEADRTTIALLGTHFKTADGTRTFVISYQTCHNT